MVAGKQDLGHFPAMPHGGAGILGVFQKAIEMALILETLRICQNAGHHAANCIGNCHGSDFTAGEYKVTCTSDFGAYVEVATDSTHRLDSIVTNDNVDTTSYVTVQDGQYLTVTGGEFTPA